MSDDFTVKLVFNSEGVPKTVGDVQKINKELAELAKQNKVVAVEASQIAGLFNVSGREAADVKRALEETVEETEEAVRAARILAEVYGLSADEVSEVEAAVKAVTEESKKAKEEFQALVAAGATALTATIGVFLNQAVNQFSEFEQFEGVLQNAFGNTTEVENAIRLVDTFADQSAQNLAEVEGSFAKLINRGINPTAEQLRQLSDLAITQGKSVDQLVEALLDAQTGENERLKEFGIQADATGKQLELTFRGITIEAEKTPQAIADAIFGLGDLQGVAGAAASNVTSLQGRLTLLSNESTRASRTFGELVASGFEPIIIGATDLLTTFNSLPSSIQGAITTSTAFVGALSAAVAAVTAYNLVIGTKVAQEALSTVQLGKKTVAQISNTVSTQAATTAQAAYAVATGTATAAQQAQIAAIVGAAAALAAFTGAVTSAALVVDTFLTVTEEARKTNEQIKILRESIELLNQSTANLEDAEGLIVYRNAAAQATANVEALEERLGFVQRALDKVRGFEINGERVFFDATAAESAINQTRIKFAELSAEIDTIILKGAEAANALEDGVTLQPGVVENTVAAIDAATAALKDQAPVTAEAIQRRDTQIEKLQEYRERIVSTNEALGELGNSTDDLKNRLTELNDTLDIGQLRVQQAGQAALAALEEQRAAGTVSAEAYQKQLSAIERAGFDERVTLATDKLAELRELERATTDEDALEQIQQEILKTQIAVDQDRTNSAKVRTERLVEAEKEAEKAAKEAAKNKRDAAIEAAKEETDALKKEREEQERIATEAFDAQQRTDSQNFDTQQRQADTQFEDQQRLQDQRFQDRLQSDEATFNDRQRSTQRTFEEQQRSQEEAFNDRQRSEEQAFQSKLNEERRQGDAEFDALEREVESRIALAEASTSAERRAIKDRIEAEEKAADVRRKVEADVLRQRNSIIDDEDTELSPLEQARADFDADLQAKEAEFQEQQRLAASEFEDSQRLANQEFEDSQRLAKQSFEEEQRILEQQFEEDQRQTEAAFQEEQRLLEQQFEDQQRSDEATFKAGQRLLDENSANEIASILKSARNTGPEARREGGPVKSGQPYLVGEDGPELIFPSRSGFVATAGQTAKLLSQVGGFTRSVAVAASPIDTTAVEKKLDQLIKVVSKKPRPIAPATINLGSGATENDAIKTALNHQMERLRRMGL